MTLHRLPREQYAVGEFEDARDFSVTVGLYYSTGEDTVRLMSAAYDIASVSAMTCGHDHEANSLYVQDYVDRSFPGRPFYVETRREGRGVQVYQPYGMPRDE